MKPRNMLFILPIAAILILPGCMTYDQYVKIDEQVQKITALREQAEDKLTETKTGELTAPDALAWVKEANKQILEANNELNKLKKGSNIGWAELLGAVAASMFGGTGLVRAWRGPSHKNTTLNT